MKQPLLLAVARRYVAHGLSVFPWNVQTKIPLGGWKEYQTRYPTPDELEQWYGDADPSEVGIAIVTGSISGGLCVIDFDHGGYFWDRWLEATHDLRDGLVVEESGGGGKHVFFRCPNPGRSRKLAWIPDVTHETGRRIGGETRAEGNMIFVAPSMHPSGGQYRLLQGRISQVPTITQARADALIDALAALDEAPLTIQDQIRMERAKQREERRSLRVLGRRRIDAVDVFNRTYTITDILEELGYIRQGRKYRHPSCGRASVVIDDEGNRSYHWSAGDPLCDGYWHHPFSAWCKVRHYDDFQEAVKEAKERLHIG